MEVGCFQASLKESIILKKGFILGRSIKSIQIFEQGSPPTPEMFIKCFLRSNIRPKNTIVYTIESYGPHRVYILGKDRDINN